MNWRDSSNSSSVSPGNPTITSAPIAASGISCARLHHAIRIVPRPVLAMHPAQNRIGARLQRRVHVLRDARRFRHQAEQIVGEIHRLDGTQANALDLRFGEQTPQQIGQPHRAAGFPAPAAQIDAGEHHFSVLRAERAHLLDDLVRADITALAAHKGNDAEGAAVVAAILNLEIGTRAIAGRHRESAPSEYRAFRKYRRSESGRDREHRRAVSQQSSDLRLVRIADHPFDARHLRQFIRRALRIAAGDQNARARDFRDAPAGSWSAHRDRLPR